VADEDVGELELVLQVGQQVEHLRLHRQIERRNGLIEHQEAGLEHQRAGNRNALALAAGEHMRIAV
jgi:hypothetical protein